MQFILKQCWHFYVVIQHHNICWVVTKENVDLVFRIFIFWACFKATAQRLLDSFYWTQGSATRPKNSSVLMVDSLMSSRNGREASKTSRFKLMERPMATTAVDAAASLPTSFTWKPEHRFNWILFCSLGWFWIRAIEMFLVVFCELGSCSTWLFWGWEGTDYF